MEASCFEKIFGRCSELHCFAPGRVNLIGEHTDYNGGLVLPCAIDKGIHCAAARRTDLKLQFYSDSYPQDGVRVYHSDRPDLQHCWADYPFSVILALQGFGYQPASGCDFFFGSDLPEGAGLSSSAAVEVVTAFVLHELFFPFLSRQEMAVICQFAENRFIGVNCGIMDQFAVAMGKENCALLLDAHTLQHEYVPLKNAALVIVNSGVKHSLAASAYNQRRQECEYACRELNVSALCSLSPEEFERKKQSITSSLSRRRAFHAVTENQRVKQAAEALKRQDYREMGRLMRESHISLRDQYEVSCEELDLLAEAAWEIPGVYGARMTGGGFGGCTVNLMEPGTVSDFTGSISSAYLKKQGREPAVYPVSVSSGVTRCEE